MSYIGSTPTTQSFISGTDAFNGTGSATNFTLSRFVNSINDIQVVVNNVVQYPPSYSVSGNTLTISPAPSAGTNNVYVRYLSTTLQSIGVSQGSTIQFGLGSASTPSITFSNDTNTGIYSPAADTLAFVEGGTEAMRIDSSANVGIGGTSIGNRLHVQRAAGANFVGEVYLTDGTQWIIQNTNNSAGSYNSLFQANDSCLVYSNGTQNNGAFAIGQWSTSQRGIRIDGTGNFQFNSGYGSVATAYGCRAWVNFNGTGTVAIRASGNVTSITDRGTGQYTVNFTTAMPDVNYCASFGGGSNNANVTTMYENTFTDRTTTSIMVNTVATVTGAVFDSNSANVAIFR